MAICTVAVRAVCGSFGWGAMTILRGGLRRLRWGWMSMDEWVHDMFRGGLCARGWLFERIGHCFTTVLPHKVNGCSEAIVCD